MTRSFDQVAGIYDATRQMPPTALAAIAAGLERAVGATPATTWLEVGIGTGRIAVPLVQDGYRYTGVDPALRMLQGAQQKVAGPGQHLGLACADARTLPFADATFDVGVVVHVFHLIPDWPTAFAEVLRVIRPGGSFIYGYEQSVGEGELHLFGQQWRALLAARGVTLRGHNATDGEVRAAVQARGMEFATHQLATWPVSNTVEQLLAGHASRAYSSSWTIPDAIFPEAINDLTTWAHDHYRDHTAALAGEMGFTALVARCD